MYRIDNATSVASLPTPAAPGVNPNSYFTFGNPGAGVPATTVDQDWANAVQEEICYVIEQAGLTLDKSIHTQLLSAMKAIIAGGTSSYVASTSAANTYTATMTPAPAAYTAGMTAFILFTNANTAASTLNLNSLGAKNIKNVDISALNAGDIGALMLGVLVYDGTQFQLLNPNRPPSRWQNSTYDYAADTGSANTYAVALVPAVTSYATGLSFKAKITNANTGSCTINVNTLGAKNIKLKNGNNPLANQLLANGVYDFFYDGTNMQVLNPSDGASIQSGAYIYAADSGSANAYAISVSPAPTAYAVGQSFLVKIGNANSGTSGSTLNVNSLGTKSIITATTSTLIAGQLPANHMARLTYNGTSFVLENPAPVADQITVYTSGSGTYTTPVGAIELIVEMVGGGAGGQGSTAGGTGTSPTAGGNTTFGSLAANGGGVASPCYASGAPGTASGGDINISGNPGIQAAQNNGSGTIGQNPGGNGGSSYFGGAGLGGQIGLVAGGNANANSGSGGGGGSANNTASYVAGAGGASGGYCKKSIASPTSSYSYAVGAAGNGGTTGAGANGGNGSAGQIIVRARFQ